VTELNASGGGLFSDLYTHSKLLEFAPFDLSFDFFAVPARSTAVFEVSLEVDYFMSGDNAGDLVQVDFENTKSDFFILCPSVQLELLTAPALRVRGPGIASSEGPDD
jgi:hypothetical protein